VEVGELKGVLWLGETCVVLDTTLVETRGVEVAVARVVRGVVEEMTGSSVEISTGASAVVGISVGEAITSGISAVELSGTGSSVSIEDIELADSTKTPPSTDEGALFTELVGSLSAVG
jgi:hypothetical protein